MNCLMRTTNCTCQLGIRLFRFISTFRNELIKIIFSFFNFLQTTHQHHRPKVRRRTFWQTRIARMLSTTGRQSPRLLHFSVAKLKPCHWPQRPANRIAEYSQSRISCTAAKNSSQFGTTLCTAVSNFWQFGIRFFQLFWINLMLFLNFRRRLETLQCSPLQRR